MNRSHMAVALIAGMALATLGRTYAFAAEPLELKVGETRTINGLQIGFTSVTHDSRCPLDVTCVWMGNGAALLHAETANVDRSSFTLNTHPDFPRSFAYAGYQIRLTDLAPHPLLSDPPQPDEYVVTIEVTAQLPTLPLERSTWGRIKALYR